MLRAHRLRLAVASAAILALASCRDSAAAFEPDADAPVEDAAASVGDAGGADAAALPDAAAVSADAGEVRRDATASDAIAASDDASTTDPLAPGPGDLVIVEVQGNPQGAADTEAEYVEILNVSGRILDLEGVRLTHREWPGMGTPPVMSTTQYRVDESVQVAPGGRVLLTRSNGGYFGSGTRDHVYGGFELANGAGDGNRLRLMVPSWDRSEPPDAADVIDELIMPAGTFDNALRGRAWQLDPARVASPTAAANDDPSAWCHAQSGAALAYWNTNWGTPGAENRCR